MNQTTEKQICQTKKSEISSEDISKATTKIDYGVMVCAMPTNSEMLGSCLSESCELLAAIIPDYELGDVKESDVIFISKSAYLKNVNTLVANGLSNDAND